MKRIISLIIIITMIFGVISINAQENTDIVSTAPQGNLVDDCVDFSKTCGRSENVYPSVTAEEDKYAFDDYTMFMRNEATAQWIDYEIPENQYLIFHLYQSLQFEQVNLDAHKILICTPFPLNNL